MSLTIYGIAASRAVRPLWAAAELGLSFEHVETPYQGGATRTPEFLALNPNGRIPVLVDHRPEGEEWPGGELAHPQATLLRLGQMNEHFVVGTRQPERRDNCVHAVDDSPAELDNGSPRKLFVGLEPPHWFHRATVPSVVPNRTELGRSAQPVAGQPSWTSSMRVTKLPLGWMNATVVPRLPGRGAVSMGVAPAAIMDARASAQSSTR